MEQEKRTEKRVHHQLSHTGGPLSIYLQSMAITHKLHIKSKIREGNIISLLCCLAIDLNTSAHYTF